MADKLIVTHAISESIIVAVTEEIPTPAGVLEAVKSTAAWIRKRTEEVEIGDGSALDVPQMCPSTRQSAH